MNAIGGIQMPDLCPREINGLGQGPMASAFYSYAAGVDPIALGVLFLVLMPSPPPTPPLN